MYLSRTLEQFLPRLARQAPVLLVVGARQVGKTTLLRHAAEQERRFVTLDDPLLRDLARSDPGLFLQRFAPPVLIDEIQYAPELLPYIKMAVDEHGKDASFWLSGSQPFHLMRGVSESLAGRVAIVHLLGLSRREADGLGAEARPFLPDPARWVADPSPVLTLPDVFRRIWRGSFPALVAEPERDTDLFYSSYLQTYLQRDVRDLARVGDEAAFVRFLKATAARTARLLNLADLARDADIAPNTAKHWLSILQASGVVHLLEPWHGNPSKRLVKAPKLHFLDTGLCAWLTAWTSPEALAAGAMAGPLFESWVVAEVLRSWVHAGKSVQLHHLRDKDGKEIDLLIVRDGVAYPVEVKLAAAPRLHDVRHFSAVEAAGLRRGTGAVVCLVPRAVPLSSEDWAVPIGAI